MAIIGFGGKNYLKYSYKGEVKDLKSLFNNTGVKYNNTLTEALNPEDITPRRLIRVFRFQIVRYLQINTTIASYLYLKYGDEKKEFRIICFPGAEHLIKSKEEAIYLLRTYHKLDQNLIKLGKQAGISERVRRVLMARGLE